MIDTHAVMAAAQDHGMRVTLTSNEVIGVVACKQCGWPNDDTPNTNLTQYLRQPYGCTHCTPQPTRAKR